MVPRYLSVLCDKTEEGNHSKEMKRSQKQKRRCPMKMTRFGGKISFQNACDRDFVLKCISSNVYNSDGGQPDSDSLNSTSDGLQPKSNRYWRWPLT